MIGTASDRACPDGTADGGRISLVYRAVLAAAWPVVRWWGRLEVTGAGLLPVSGPVLLFANHDSAWDPIVIAAAVRKRRQIRALASAWLWRHRPLGWALDKMGQIPINRGHGDTAAMAAAVEELAAGACIGVFPEGTVSRGRTLRARSGAGRLALAVPAARVVCVAVTGTVDIVRFPRRPRLRVTFFEPAGGPPRPDEPAGELATRCTAEIRAIAPSAVPGRRKKAAAFKRLVAEQHHDGQRG
jgi:1-acyl-sn-glycerol-3-phosphate acyltransferase